MLQNESDNQAVRRSIQMILFDFKRSEQPATGCNRLGYDPALL
jgi:hypothetical protein